MKCIFPVISILLIVLTGCVTLTPEEKKTAIAFDDAARHVKDHFVPVKQPDSINSWKIYEELDIRDGVLYGDCDNIAMFTSHIAESAGVPSTAYWYGLFKYRDAEVWHMAIIIELWGYWCVIPSSGLGAFKQNFIPLEEYVRRTQMDLHNAFQFEWIEE